MSIQSRNIHNIQYIPLSDIKRPIPPVLDYDKIDAMVSTLKGTPKESKTCSLEEAQNLNGELPPIDVLCLRENNKNNYFAFGGCHRFQAYDKLQKEEDGKQVKVRCKVLPITRSQLGLYLGSSSTMTI
ncbi:related to Sulfiredoxin [Saccharomycodes ludwigii]|uniref:Sulfiredoxin n=1 Tax=Saccharomycodes ludwigii TaxID=36035 RepID=A0A376B915_9ASCO|nr:hypothetical protein SCDLUD_003098 [Saccharomycodes ludwigii]KAH3900130.1 hypothetical protein SCDLUD_003098 [Saccharomycodes ludwigii]SSD61166.1 related to Sulfiredoxin [Saccharomycodes ludwigii]